MASYGLINANAKLQAQSDKVLLFYRLRSSINVSQLFNYQQKENLKALFAKTIDDI